MPPCEGPPRAILSRQSVPALSSASTCMACAQHVFHLRYAGFFFEVYPREFLMHVPHAISKAKIAWRENEHRDSMDQLYKRFQQQVRASYEVPLTPLCDNLS